jgi:hypothetical protein
LAALFATQADSAVIQVLRESATALTKAEIIEALETAGVEREAAQDAWSRIQRRISRHDEVVVEKQGRDYSYRWDAHTASAPDPADAFERIVSGELGPFDRQELVEVIRRALAAPSAGGAETADLADPDAPSRQLEMDAARALAEMAMEIEELATKQASSRAMIHRVRARMKRMRLEPIDRAGDEVPFDRQRHQPIGPDIRDGAPVVVVRPGYVWRTPEKDLLIERPVVQD